MFFKIVFFLILSVIEVYAFTISYKCKDAGSGFESYVNVDHDTLHFRESINSPIVSLEYVDTNTTFSKLKNMIGYHFSDNNQSVFLTHNKFEPEDLRIYGYIGEKLWYVSHCSLDSIFKESEEIPRTLLSLDIPKEKTLEILEKESIKIDKKLKNTN